MKVLAISCHLDDIELGAGATLVKFLERGYEVTYIGLSWCDNPNLTKECQASTAALGIFDIKVYNFDRRLFHLKRQEILDLLIKLREQIKPDIIFCPASYDVNRDHKVTSEECVRAFPSQEIYGYDFPWNYTSSQTNCPSEITKEQLEKKITALKCYESQKERTYFDEGFIRAIAKVRGVQFRCEYAEAFEVIRTKI